MRAQTVAGNTGNVINFSEELKKCKTQDDLFGEEGLIKRMVKTAIEGMMQAEMEEYLGRKKNEPVSSDDPNYRNAYRNKDLRSSAGEMEIEIPRDRKGDFQPKVIENYETSCGKFDRKIISMYSKGMSVRDIQSELKDIYGVEVSPAFISVATDKVMTVVNDWQNRILAHHRKGHSALGQIRHPCRHRPGHWESHG